MTNSPPDNPNRFETPTAAQLTRHLEAHPPIQGNSWQAKIPHLAIAAVGLLMLAMLFQPAMMLLPLLGLLGLSAYLSSRTRTGHEMQERVNRAWELTMIRRYREALGEAWRLLPSCRSTPELHGRVVTIMAHILGELGKDESAEVAYAYLMDRLPKDHPLSLRLRVQRAIAALREGRLADGDDALRRLRGEPNINKNGALLASYTLARLLQDVRTGHFADAIEHADDTAEALKPLGIEAGYGHGLLALCYQQLADRQAKDPDATNPLDQIGLARQSWQRATLLLPSAALLFQYPELAPLADTMEGQA